MKTLEATAVPVTLAERIAFGEDEVLTIPMSFEEYLEWAEKCEYNVEYINGNLISMGQATFIHEALVMRLGAIFYLLFGQSDYTILGSNIKIFSPSFLPERHGAYNADVSVVKGQPVYMVKPNGKVSTATILNPIVIVEVLSDATVDTDFGSKLTRYKTIESLQQIIFVSQKEPYITTYIKEEVHKWLNLDFVNLTDQVPVLDGYFSMQDVYRGIL